MAAMMSCTEVDRKGRKWEECVGGCDVRRIDQSSSAFSFLGVAGTSLLLLSAKSPMGRRPLLALEASTTHRPASSVMKRTNIHVHPVTANEAVEILLHRRKKNCQTWFKNGVAEVLSWLDARRGFTHVILNINTDLNPSAAQVYDETAGRPARLIRTIQKETNADVLGHWLCFREFQRSGYIHFHVVAEVPPDSSGLRGRIPTEPKDVLARMRKLWSGFGDIDEEPKTLGEDDARELLKYLTDPDKPLDGGYWLTPAQARRFTFVSSGQDRPDLGLVGVRLIADRHLDRSRASAGSDSSLRSRSSSSSSSSSSPPPPSSTASRSSSSSLSDFSDLDHSLAPSSDSVEASTQLVEVPRITLPPRSVLLSAFHSLASEDQDTWAPVLDRFKSCGKRERFYRCSSCERRHSYPLLCGYSTCSNCGPTTRSERASQALHLISGLASPLSITIPSAPSSSLSEVLSRCSIDFDKFRRRDVWPFKSGVYSKGINLDADGLWGIDLRCVMQSSRLPAYEIEQALNINWSNLWPDSPSIPPVLVRDLAVGDLKEHSVELVRDYCAPASASGNLKSSQIAEFLMATRNLKRLVTLGKLRGRGLPKVPRSSAGTTSASRKPRSCPSCGSNQTAWGQE
jgi:hypothetical protein